MASLIGVRQRHPISRLEFQYTFRIAAAAKTSAQAVTNIAASKATAQTMATVAGRAAGVLAAPVVEMVAMKLDGKEQSGRDYAIAAGCGAGSAVAGMIAGAAVGSAVPVMGTAVGALIGLVTCTLLKRRFLKAR